MSDSKVPAQIGPVSLTLAKRGDAVTAVLERIPAEAIVTVVDLVADVVRANKIMEGRAQEFEQTLSLLREGNMDRRERMAALSNLLRELRLAEDAQMRLVESICRIAEGV